MSQTLSRHAAASTSHERTPLASRLVGLLFTWQQRASERRHLGSLGDRALRDVGLSRADIEQEMVKPFWRA